MPPDIDVYEQIHDRSAEVVVQFLEEYMPGWGDRDRWLDDEPLGVAMARAMTPEGDAFARYGRSGVLGADMAVIAFPSDGSLVLGLSVGEDEARGRMVAVDLLNRLFDQFDGSRGVVIWEEPPLTWAEDVGGDDDPRVCARRP